MDSTGKPKKQLTPEQLEKLKVAREKALAVRQEKARKMKELKELEKKQASTVIDQKINDLKSSISDLQPAQQEPIQQEEVKPVETPARAVRRGKKSKVDVIKKIVEESSSDSSESESDNDQTDAIKHFLKNKYKNKYRAKYESKSVQQLSRGVAAQAVKKKYDDELMKYASMSIFGS